LHNGGGAFQEAEIHVIYRIPNPQANSLIPRVPHTDLLFVADRGFPFWLIIEMVDLSLADNVPTVLKALNAACPNLASDKYT
jgi:D-ribose pyranose/furanose isomerase RbsD